MTEETTDAEQETLGELSHTNPYTGETFGDTQTYTRGRLVATDGGDTAVAGNSSSSPATTDVTEADTVDSDATTERTLGDISHTPPRNAPRASAAYMQGNENAADE